MKNLKPLKLLPARERVASALRRAILAKELKEGETITLEQIAKQLGVSAMPVREAFQLLNSEGLIEVKPNKGATVLGINEKTIRDHYETRWILESECIYKVCSGSADISEIEDFYEQAIEALKNKNYQDYTNYNQAFHMAIWTAADNEKIKSLLSSIWNGLPVGSQMTEESYADLSMGEHEELMNAIRERHADLAKDLMKKHLQRSLENMLTYLTS